MDKLKIYTSEAITENGNIFTPIAIKVQNIMEVRRAYRKIKQQYPAATHIPMAYEAQKRYGNCNDGEHGAGLTIQKFLEEQSIANRAIFIPRMYSGKKLGPKRFEIFTKATKLAIASIK